MFPPHKISVRLAILFVSAIATGLFTACGNPNAGNSPNNQSLSTPAIDTTKTSPPVAPKVAASPPKPAIALNKLPELSIKELVPYRHKSGILELPVPQGWELSDKSQTGELLLTWNEQNGRATISANIFVPPSEIPEERLSDTFTSIIKGMYGEQPNFVMQTPVLESTGNVVIAWTSTLTFGDEQVKFQANSKLQRINNKFVILTFGAIEPKFETLKDFFFRIANEQVINGELAIP
jgi:hypothetical protein